MRRLHSIFLILGCLILAAFCGVSGNPYVTQMRVHLGDGRRIDLDVDLVDSITYPELEIRRKMKLEPDAREWLADMLAGCRTAETDTMVAGGLLSPDDIRFIRNNFENLEVLDLWGAKICPKPGRRDKLHAEQPPEDVLPDSGFRNLHMLREVWLPRSLKRVGKRAFDRCPSLRRVYIDAQMPPELGEDAFCGMERSVSRLTVPEGCAAAYAASAWGRYFRIYERRNQAELPTDRFDDDLMVFRLGGYEDVTLDPERGFLQVRVPYGEDLTALTEYFYLRDGLTAFMDGRKLESGSTCHDYSRPRTLSLVGEDGSVRELTVLVCFSDLPMVYINTERGAPIANREEYVAIDDIYVANCETNARYAKARIKGRGNSSWDMMPKKSYTLKLDKKDALLGMKKHKTFALVANYCDKTMRRNSMAYEWGREIFDNMAWTPSTRFLNLVVNGEYRGVYSLTETCKIDKNRIDIPNLEDCESEADAPDFGFLVEVNGRLDENFNFTTARNVCFSLKDPDGEDLSQELRDYVQLKIQTCENALYHANFRLPDSQYYYRDIFDIPSWIDWYLVNEIARNKDANFYASCFMYYDPADGKLHMGPLWDFDIAFGNVNIRDIGEPEGFYLNRTKWLIRMWRDPDFVAELKARYFEKRDELAAYVEQSLQRQADELAEDAEMNFRRWPILGKYVWPNADGFEERTTYQSEIDYLRDWLQRRLEWLDTAFEQL